MPRRFDFISPGVSIVEVDESTIPAQTGEEDGVLLIGKAKKGPANVPVKITSLENLYAVFGEPVSGKGSNSGDVWRNGNDKYTSYAMYAAQAWLASETSPVKFIRLLGIDSDNQASGYIKAGFDIPHVKSKTAAANNIAYGMFLAPSRSANQSAVVTGTLAAVIYTSGSSIGLVGSGINQHGESVPGSTNTFVLSDSTAGGVKNTFKLRISSSLGTSETKTFHFDKNKKDGFIRNVLNCNPQKLESINFGTSAQEKYFLGATFENEVDKITQTSSSVGQQVAVLIPLLSSSAFDYGNNLMEAKAAKTGWFINRNPSPVNYASFNKGNASKLFRICSLHEGEEFQKNYGIRIENLKLGSNANPDSTFSVILVNNNGEAAESFIGCTLNEASSNFIGKKIGDRYQEWNSTLKKYELKGEYPNKSDFIRVEMADDWKAGISDSKMLPFGFHLPRRPNPLFLVSGSTTGGEFTLGGTPLGNIFSNLDQGTTGSTTHQGGSVWNFVDIDHQPSDFAGYFMEFPELNLTTQNSNNSKNYTKDFTFGVRQVLKSEDKPKKVLWSTEDYKDLVRALPDSLDIHGDTSSVMLTTGSVFTLDDIIQDTVDTTRFYYEDGAHVGKDAVTSKNTVDGTNAILSGGVKQFNVPFVGGFDGLNIKKVEQFSIEDGLSNDYSDTLHYAAATVKRAINIAADKDLINYDVISMPGLLHTNLTQDVIRASEERGDSLAIIDIDSGYRKPFENSGTEVLGDATQGGSGKIISTAQDRDYNTSYAATYYPPVRLKDTVNNGDVTVVPASVAAVGALASSEANSEGPWFAPAGFNRGGLSTLGGSAGPRVVGTIEHLTKQDRDDLYEENINPIARFPAVGEIVIFGQKTLQQTPSALDRVNVRRLMIYLKKKIGKIADTILFDQNVRATWLRFKSKAENVLSDVQSRFGITEYKLVLDETTTTADLIDRNILYAKVFIKPARAIEFIAIDFVITKTGIEL
jgi:hypothetical protein